jgi:VWFA-related protein
MLPGPKCSRIEVITALLIVLSSSSLFQQDKNSRAQTPSTFKIPVNVIFVNVTAADKDGNPVTDLTRDEFTIYEDGKLQSIQTFAVESYRPIEQKSENLQKSTSPPVQAQEPGGAHPRFISIVIDDITTESSENYPRIMVALKDFIENDLGPLDRVAILLGSGRVGYPFSDIRGTLLEEVDALSGRLNVNHPMKWDCPQLTALQAEGIFRREDPDALSLAIAETMECLKNRERKIAEYFAVAAATSQHEEANYRNRTLLDVLRRHIRSLRHFEGTKSVILFSGGFMFKDIAYELEDVADQALRSGVVLNTIDVRGLYTAFPTVEQSSPITSSPSLLQKMQEALKDDALAHEKPLNQLASDTGGLFHHNTNDIGEGLLKISDRTSCYYVLTYSAPSMKPDGRYHRIKLETSHPGITLTYRKGYYSPKEELTFERRRKEDILEAMQAPGNLNEIPIQLAYNYYQQDDSAYAVSVLTNIDIRSLRFLDEDSRRINQISIAVVALDEADHYMDGVVKSIDFRLTDASYENLLDYGLNSKVEFKLPMGRYKIKEVVREGTQGRMGSITKAIEIP